MLSLIFGILFHFGLPSHHTNFNMATRAMMAAFLQLVLYTTVLLSGSVGGAHADLAVPGLVTNVVAIAGNQSAEVHFEPSTDVYDAVSFGQPRYRVTVHTSAADASFLPPAAELVASSAPVYILSLTNGIVRPPSLVYVQIQLKSLTSRSRPVALPPTTTCRTIGLKSPQSPALAPLQARW